MPEIKKMLSAGIQRFVCSSMPGKTVKGRPPVQLSRHEALEFFLVIQGESRFQIEDKLFDIRPGDMCLIEPWVTHASGFYADDHDLLQFWLHLGKDGLSGHFIQVEKQGHFKVIMNPLRFSYAISDMLRKRWLMAKKEGVITEKSLNKYLRTPLTFILEDVLLDLEQRPKKNGSADINTVESIKQYIRNRQGCNCSLEKLEEFTGYSKFYLSHLFKAKTGSTIGKFINGVRVEYTAEAELHGIPYKEIACQLGFSSIQAFSPWKKNNKKKILEFKEWIRKKAEISTLPD